MLLSGVLSDAFGAARPALLCFLLRIVIFGFIIYSQDTVAVAAFALVYGFTFLVTAPLTVVFAGAIFGQGRLGLVAGSISMIHQISGAGRSSRGVDIRPVGQLRSRVPPLAGNLRGRCARHADAEERPLALLGTTPADLN